MSTECIRVRDLTKSFHGRKVVDGLSFSVEKGQVFGLLGHNGAGKSTTIEMILGLKKPDSGKAEIFGMEAAGHRKEIFEKTGVQLQASNYQTAIRVDELTTGLDVVARREVWRTLRGLKEKGITIFLTTHYMEEAEKLCDRIMLIRNGQMVTEGTVEEVVDASPYEHLEEAYLWYMGEEVAL